MTEMPAVNSPEARTVTGELIDQSQPTPVQDSTPTTTEAPKPTEPQSLLNSEDPKLEAPTGAPETYADFTVREGQTLDPALVSEAAPMFKEMNLSQDQAQKLIDFYNGKAASLANASYQAFLDMREGWVKQVKADPEIGPKMKEVKETIGRALNGLGDAKLVENFRQVMDETGAGDHPAFVKAFYKLAQRVTEGRSVSPGGPAEVIAPGANAKPTAAQALYPGLSSNTPPQRG